MAPAGEDAEELTLPRESDRMVRGTLGHVMQHRVVAVHTERRDCRSGGARNAPSRLIKNGGTGGDWAKADCFLGGCRGGAGDRCRILGQGWCCWLGLRRPSRSYSLLFRSTAQEMRCVRCRRRGPPHRAAAECRAVAKAAADRAGASSARERRCDERRAAATRRQAAVEPSRPQRVTAQRSTAQDTRRVQRRGRRPPRRAAAECRAVANAAADRAGASSAREAAATSGEQQRLDGGRPSSLRGHGRVPAQRSTAQETRRVRCRWRRPPRRAAAECRAVANAAAD